MEIICQNCDFALQPDFQHCPKCGQKSGLHRLSLHDVFHEAIHYLTHADKGLFQLIRDLAVKNGKVAREFVNGKRKKYYPPLTFFFLVIAINLFVSTRTDSHVNVNVEKKYSEINEITDPVKKAKWIHIYERREKGIHWINTNVNNISMVSLPMVALIFWLFYRRRRYNYVEHLVGGMYMFGFCTLFTAAISTLAYLIGANENIGYATCLLFQLGYYAIFYRNFMEGKKLRAFCAALVAMLLLFVISGLLMWVYMFYAE
jgi:hypothetical protein